jgi:hypothetical protein
MQIKLREIDISNLAILSSVMGESEKEIISYMDELVRTGWVVREKDKYYWSHPYIATIEELESRFDLENFFITLEDIVLDANNPPMHTKEQVEMFREYLNNRGKTKKIHITPTFLLKKKKHVL